MAGFAEQHTVASGAMAALTGQGASSGASGGVVEAMGASADAGLALDAIEEYLRIVGIFLCLHF